MGPSHASAPPLYDSPSSNFCGSPHDLETFARDGSIWYKLSVLL